MFSLVSRKFLAMRNITLYSVFNLFGELFFSIPIWQKQCPATRKVRKRGVKTVGYPLWESFGSDSTKLGSIVRARAQFVYNFFIINLMDLSEFRLMTPAKCSGLSEQKGGRGTALPDLIGELTLSQRVGEDYAHHITKCPPPPPDLPTALVLEGKPRSSSTSYEKIDFGTQKKRRKLRHVVVWFFIKNNWLQKIERIQFAYVYALWL
jgi:hypothetical protein